MIMCLFGTVDTACRVLDRNADGSYRRGVMRGAVGPEVATLAQWIEDASYVVALTGAGVSTDSGIPDFRSGGGLWAEVDPEKVASIGGFLSDPEGFYRFWGRKHPVFTDARPNVAHRVLAELEARGLLHALVTQNIDGLHLKAGSERVLEVHGSLRTASCIACRRPEPIESVFEEATRRTPTCLHCGGLVKPDVVLFGEMLPPAFEASQLEVDRSDLLIVLGSSLEVFPVADLVPRAKQAGSKVVLVNREPGPFAGLADLVVRGELGTAMQQLGHALSLPV